MQIRNSRVYYIGFIFSGEPLRPPPGGAILRLATQYWFPSIFSDRSSRARYTKIPSDIFDRGEKYISRKLLVTWS